MTWPRASRTAWVLLAGFCATALIAFVVSVGRDIALVRGMQTAQEPPRHVVRMPIIIEEKQPVRLEPTPEPAVLPSPTPAERSSGAEEPAPTPTPTPAAPIAAPDAPGTLLAHEFKHAKSGFEARFRTDKPVSGAKLSFLSSPARWVVDLPGAWKNKARRDMAVDQGSIGRVVIGEHPKFLRVVFYYQDQNSPRPAQLPVVAEEEKGFRVAIYGR